MERLQCDPYECEAELDDIARIAGVILCRLLNTNKRYGALCHTKEKQTEHFKTNTTNVQLGLL